MKNMWLNAFGAVALASAPAPVFAQEEEPVDEAMAGMAEMFSGLFTAEPLTEEQEARLPLTTQLVAKVMPDGFYAQMMEETMGGIMEPFFSMMPQTMPAADIATHLGQPTEVIEALSEEKRTEIATVIDPLFAQRTQAGIDYMMDEMIGVLSGIEPYMRDGLARAYAVRFSDAQLDDIAAFFATDTGAHYASESMMIFTDPQVMSASMQAMPMMLEELPRIIGEMQTVVEQFEPARSYEDLGKEERASIADALGISDAELKDSMASSEQSLTI